MKSANERKNLLKWANWLIDASVVLGIFLLAQLYALRVPLALLIPILVGWILYLIVAIAVSRGHSNAYPIPGGPTIKTADFSG